MNINLNRLEKPSLFEKFKTQVYKDYELSGTLEFMPIINSNNLDDLINGFYNSIIRLELSNNLKNLLYRIDINEIEIKKEIQKNPNKNLQQLLAELMIKRILEKVIFKELYSK